MRITRATEQHTQRAGMCGDYCLIMAALCVEQHNEALLIAGTTSSKPALPLGNPPRILLVANIVDSFLSVETMQDADVDEWPTASLKKKS